MKTFSLFAKHERFFILEIGPETVSGVGIAVSEEKKIIVTNIAGQAPWGSRVKWRTSLGIRKTIPLIALDPSLSYTALIPITHVRDRIRDPLRATELEDIIGQHVGRALTQCRKEAARELDVDELDALLVKSHVTNFQIDSHKVLNPLGFRAQRVEALVRITFTTRGAFHEAKRIVGEKTKLLFTDVADAELAMLERLEALPLNLIRIGKSGAVRWSVKQTPGGYSLTRGNLAWRSRGFWEAIMEAWGVSPDVAERAYQAYKGGNMSEPLKRSLDKLFLPRIRSFFAEVQVMKLKGPLYIDASFELPFPVTGKKGTLSLKDMPVKELCDLFGFEVEGNEGGFHLSIPFRTVAVFFAHYYDKSEQQMNAWLAKHLAWLGSPVERKM